MNQGVVGHVARSGEIYITQDINKDPNFSKSTDKKTGYQTRRLLCFPILSSKGEIVAVGQLCNKIKGNCFSEFDRRLALRFVDLCAATLQHVSKTKQKKSYLKCIYLDSFLATIGRQMIIWTS